MEKKTTNNRSGDRDGKSSGRGRRAPRKEREPREYEQKIVDLTRVVRVTAGGKRMSFRCGLVIGDKKGRVGFGVAKGADVQIAIEKAFRQAKKNIITVPMINGTITHAVKLKYGAVQIMIKPAPQGTGLKSGGAMRMVLEIAGVPNAVSRILNSSNKVNIAKATMLAISKLRQAPEASVKEKTSESSSAGETAKKPEPAIA